MFNQVLTKIQEGSITDTEINLIFEVAEAAAIYQLGNIKQLNGTNDAKRIIRNWLQKHSNECFCYILLDNQNQVIEVIKKWEGNLNSCHVFPAEIARDCLMKNAVRVILFHNHPSGHIAPSSADIEITNKIRDALRLIDVEVIDHIIIGKEGEYSFAEKGMLI